MLRLKKEHMENNSHFLVCLGADIFTLKRTKKKETGEQREDARKRRPNAECVKGEAIVEPFVSLRRLPSQVAQQQRKRREHYRRDNPFNSTHCFTSIGLSPGG